MTQPLAARMMSAAKARLRRTRFARTLRIMLPMRTFMLRLRRLRPISDHWGFDRGQPVDRYYIDEFMASHRADVRGRVLEVGAPRYAAELRGPTVERIDIVDVDPNNPQATIVGDLTAASTLPEASFDCVILTQVIQAVFDPAAAVRSSVRSLRPGGVLLATLPAISRMESEGLGITRYWNFTLASARALFRAHFPEDALEIRAHGNLRVAIAFLEGRASDEVPRRALDYNDPEYAVVITVRARRGQRPA
jgi:SAM-dependent methyltransferase